ncbi:MAG: 4Fe-4S dicluster domain-containing protein [Aminipila sp.]
MKLISPDVTKCVKCHVCVEVCPMGVIGVSTNGFPEPKSCAYRLCINCGYCVDVCVLGALNHRVRKRSSNSEAAIKRYEVLQKNKKGEINEK